MLNINDEIESLDKSILLSLAKFRSKSIGPSKPSKFKLNISD